MKTEIGAFVAGLLLALAVTSGFDKMQAAPPCPSAPSALATAPSPGGGEVIQGSELVPGLPQPVAEDPSTQPTRRSDVLPSASFITTEAPAQPAPVQQLDSAGSPMVPFDASTGAPVPSELPSQPVPPGMLETAITDATPLDVTVWYYKKHVDAPVRFFIDELLPKATNFGKITERPVGTEQKWKPHHQENVINDPNQANILIIDGRAEEEWCNHAIVSKCAYLSPALSVLIRDDQSAKEAPCAERKLSDMTPLVLRHHTDEALGRKNLFNVFAIPMGYSFAGDALGKLPAGKDLVPSADREIQWRYLHGNEGPLVEDESMFKVLGQALPRGGVKQTSGAEERIRELGRAVFAPATRVPSGLDQSRIYDACRLGAIPVIVGSGASLTRAFTHFVGMPAGEKPPFVFAHTWNEAVEAMSALIKAPADLNAQQQKVLTWWSTAFEQASVTVRKAIEADYLRRQTDIKLGQMWQDRGRPDVAARFLKPVMPWSGMSDLNMYEEIKPGKGK